MPKAYYTAGILHTKRILRRRQITIHSNTPFSMSNSARIIAFYLPQYHPIPENDTWWGKGFTEWTNVAKAKPLFKGHDQPRIPADLGYYDLRVPEVREAQAQLAKTSGIEGFCYWHYWFGNGKRLLERPFDEVLKSGQPDFPFCLAWANETWQGFDFGSEGRNVLIEQNYPGEEDYIAHFQEVLPAFLDKRYIQVNGKPLFYIYKPEQLPNPSRFIELWQELAKKSGLKGVFFVCQGLDRHLLDQHEKAGFDAINTNRFKELFHKRSLWSKIQRRVFRLPVIFNYKEVIKILGDSADAKENYFPTVIPNWDHTPRSGRRGNVFQNSTPKLFKKHLSDTLETIKDKPYEKKIIFLKSWNEWAEGNYVEPDKRFGLGYLEVIKSLIIEK